MWRSLYTMCLAFWHLWPRNTRAGTCTPACKHRNGRLPFDPKFRNFRNGDKWYGNFPGKVLENLEIVEFPKSEPFSRKFRKFRDENQMERPFPGNYVRKFGYTPQGCPLFWKFCKLAICHSALVVLATITASWTSHARKMETRIRKWKYFRIIPLLCR